VKLTYFGPTRVPYVSDSMLWEMSRGNVTESVVGVLEREIKEKRIEEKREKKKELGWYGGG